MALRIGRLVFSGVVTVMGFAAVPAAADVTKAQCVTANASGQDLRRDGKLAEARDQLRLCSDPKCPGIVHTDCTKRLDELEAAQPTIVFDAKDGTGADITDVKVSVDGRLLVEKLDGSALQVDPGDHTFKFEVTGQEPVTERVVLKEGEKGRHEKVVIGAAPPPPSPSPPLPPPPPPPPPSEGMGTQKLLGLVAGGVGVAGIGVGAVFGVLTASAISKQKSDCASATSCANLTQAASDHSTWTTDGTISTVAFIAGGALLAAGAVLVLTAHSSSEQPAAARLIMVPSAGVGGAGMVLRGEF